MLPSRARWPAALTAAAFGLDKLVKPLLDLEALFAKMWHCLQRLAVIIFIAFIALIGFLFMAAAFVAFMVFIAFWAFIAFMALAAFIAFMAFMAAIVEGRKVEKAL